MAKEKKKVGRPTKLTEKVIKALKEVSENAIYLTDEDLLFLLNEKLTEKEQIATQTFKEYKGGVSQSSNVLMKKFTYYIKKALIKEKQELLKLVKEGENGWQSKSWILERKFNEWNLKTISENMNTNKTELTLDDKLSKIGKISFIDNTVSEDEI